MYTYLHIYALCMQASMVYTYIWPIHICICIFVMCLYVIRVCEHIKYIQIFCKAAHPKMLTDSSLLHTFISLLIQGKFFHSNLEKVSGKGPKTSGTYWAKVRKTVFKSDENRALEVRR